MVANYLFDYFELNNRKNLIRPRLIIVGYELVKTFPNWQILPYELLMFTTKKRAVIIKKSRLLYIRPALNSFINLSLGYEVDTFFGFGY